MGLFRALFPKKIKDPVAGTAQIVSCSGTSENATHQTCVMQLVVQAEGIEPFAVEHTQILKVSKWPSPGMTIPAVMSQSDPTNLRLDFDAIPEWQDAGMDRAEQIAAAMRDAEGGTPGAGSQTVQMPGGGAAQVHMVNLSGGPVDPAEAEQAISQAEQATGMDLNADGKIGSGAAPAAPVAPDDGADRIAQLERLAKLHDSGALSDEEFEAEKTRLRDGA